MNTVIVGQGAIGLLCYHRLTCSQLQERHVNAVALWPSKPAQQSYYTFAEMNEQGKAFPLTFADKESLSRAQVIILCVKSYQVADVFQAIHSSIADNAVIILAHNGLGTKQEISHLLKPSQCLLALLLTQAAKKVANYHVMHTGIGNSDLGIIAGELSSLEKNKLRDYFCQSLTQVNWQDNIEQAQWRKLAINCVINPLTALDNIDNGKIKLPIYQEKITKIIEEVVAVASKESVQLNADSLRDLVAKVAENTAKNTSSMRADVLAKRKTEIDYINGYIHHLGENYQLATPLNTQLWLAVKAHGLKDDKP